MGDFTHTLHKYDVLPEYTKNTRSYTMTWTGHDRRFYNQYWSLPTTLYTSYTIMCESSEYTKNTRSCTMTWTGHDRWLYKRLTLLLGLRSTGVGIWYEDHGRALPTVRIIVPSSCMVSVWPNTITQSISDQYVIVLYLLTERAMIKWYLTLSSIWNILHNNTNRSRFLHIYTRKVILPHS